MLKGEKAVASWDEDSVTMAVSAAVDCLKEQDRDRVEGVYFATTTPPYSLREDAGIIAAALDLKDNTRTMNFFASNKSGTAAFLAAADAINGGSLNNCIAAASDCRVGKLGGHADYSYGDAAAAFLIAKDDVIATIDGSFSTTRDFVDRRRMEGSRYEHMWEERFIRESGYKVHIPEAINGLLKQCNLNLENFSKVCYSCGFPAMHAAVAKTLKLAPEQIQDTLMETVGDSGVAQPVLMLAAALEDAKAGDKIMVVSFGQGCDAIALTVTDKIGRVQNTMSLQKGLAGKAALSSVERYLVFKNMVPVEVGIKGEEIPFTSFSVLSRNSKEILAMVGTKCTKCGTPSWPAQIVCPNPECGAIDQFEPYRMSDKTGKIFSFTTDFLAPAVDPPSSYALIDVDGGGRVICDFTDTDYSDLKVDAPVEFSFRVKNNDPRRDSVTYMWKVRLI